MVFGKKKADAARGTAKTLAPIPGKAFGVSGKQNESDRDGGPRQGERFRNRQPGRQEEKSAAAHPGRDGPRHRHCHGGQRRGRHFDVLHGGREVRLHNAVGHPHHVHSAHRGANDRKPHGRRPPARASLRSSASDSAFASRHWPCSPCSSAMLPPHSPSLPASHRAWRCSVSRSTSPFQSPR